MIVCFFKQNMFLVAVFITGACVLIVEIVATRILSPFFGSTIFTISSVISVILLALSLGYYAGGRLADRHPSPRLFFGIILFSGIVLLASHFIGSIILPVFGYVLSISTGPLIFSIILFFFPALLLGSLSPYAVKLQSINSLKQGVGSVAGKVFFWSTLGSIIGSLSAGFFLIPHFGVNQIIIGTGMILFFLGFIPLLASGNSKHLNKFLTAFLFLSSTSIYVSYVMNGNYLYSKDGVYEKVTIFDGQYGGRPVRFFRQDRSSAGAMFLDSDDPRDVVYDYLKYYSIYKVFNPKIQNILVIGGGAYSIPKALLADLPNADIQVSEIEPSLYNLAKRYFGLNDNVRLQNYTEDGRRFLADSDKNYDLIFSDVYHSLFSIPSHFTTQEFFKIAKNKLNTDGIFIANIIGDLSLQKPSFIMSEIKTFQTVFPNSYFFAVGSPDSIESQNIIFVGYNSKKEVNLNISSIINHSDSIIRSLSQQLINTDRFDLSPYPILTDNYSPVEYLTGKVLKRNF